jgi:hypothetical protein
MVQLPSGALFVLYMLNPDRPAGTHSPISPILLFPAVNWPEHKTEFWPTAKADFKNQLSLAFRTSYVSMV